MKAFEEWLYSENDWLLFGVACALVIGGLYVLFCWMFRGTEITPETRKELHDATKE